MYSYTPLTFPGENGIERSDLYPRLFTALLKLCVGPIHRASRQRTQNRREIFVVAAVLL
jgi:hypothetical protein